MESNQLDEILSDSTSSRGSDTRLNSMSGPGSGPVFMEAAHTIHQNSESSVTRSDVSVGEETSKTRPQLYTMNRGPSNNSLDGPRSLSRSNQTDTGSLLRSMSSVRNSKLGRTRSEIIAISGTAGLGKSKLVQSIQTTARSAGYFASAKFDPAKKAPFEPILKLMSSLFRQIFSEADVGTEFHTNVRNYLRNSGVWAVLHSYLDLPEWLLSSGGGPQTPHVPSCNPHDSTKGDIERRASSPAVHGVCSSHTTDAWLRSGGVSKSSRFMGIFIDILRLLAMQKLCIWSLEDVQNSDPESAELISHIGKSKIPIVLIITYQDEESVPKDIRALMTSAKKILLSPFTEEQTAEYVAETLHRDTEYILPLVAVIQEKSGGNVFYIREILDTCYRKNCVYYCWKEGNWVSLKSPSCWDELTDYQGVRFGSRLF